MQTISSVPTQKVAARGSEARPRERNVRVALTIQDHAVAAAVSELVRECSPECATLATSGRPDTSLWIVDESVPVVDLKRFVAGPAGGAYVIRLGAPVPMGPRVLSVAERGVELLRSVLERTIELIGATAKPASTTPSQGEQAPCVCF